MNEKRILEITNNLHSWFINCEYKGIDPYQLDEKAFGIIKKVPFLGYVRKILKPFHSLIPEKTFNNFPHIYHPKAIALIISANSHLYKISKDHNLLTENLKLLKILDSLRNHNFRYACWGHPFEWGQNPRYPKDTPFVCVQAPIAHSLIDFYEIYGNKKILEIIESAAGYLLEEADYDNFGGSSSFHNSPLDKTRVHNSNIMAAAFFYRLYKINRNEELNVFADKLINFTLDAQNEDGSWFYGNKKGGEKIKTIDNRHTGFVLKALHQIYQINKNEEIKTSLNNGLDFYKKNLFENEIPKWSLQKTYPVDIHDVAQAIITFTEIGDLEFAGKIVDFAIDKMSNNRDEFYYKYFKNGKTNKAVFIRWGQAWMMLALASLLEAMEETG